MAKLSITKNKLLKEYKKEINDIADTCEWISVFSGKDICNIVMNILDKNKIKTKLSTPLLYVKYTKHVDNLNITREEWVKKYGVPEIIDIIYEILKENT